MLHAVQVDAGTGGLLVYLVCRGCLTLMAPQTTQLSRKVTRCKKTDREN